MTNEIYEALQNYLTHLGAASKATPTRLDINPRSGRTLMETLDQARQVYVSAIAEATRQYQATTGSPEAQAVYRQAALRARLRYQSHSAYPRYAAKLRAEGTPISR